MWCGCELQGWAIFHDTEMTAPVMEHCIFGERCIGSNISLAARGHDHHGLNPNCVADIGRTFPFIKVEREF